MWKGKFDEKLKQLFVQYDEKFGCEPDTYEEISYDTMSYEQFSEFIKTCLEKNIEIDDIVK